MSQNFLYRLFRIREISPYEWSNLSGFRHVVGKSPSPNGAGIEIVEKPNGDKPQPQRSTVVSNDPKHRRRSANQAAEYFRLGEQELARNKNKQRMIVERYWSWQQAFA
jgi:hypothetical protein